MTKFRIPVPRVWHVPADAPTIAAGIDSAAFGDTVEVAAGTYHEYNLALEAGVYLRSEGRSAESVTIDAGELGRVMAASYVDETCVVDGFTLTAGYPTSHGGGLYIQYASPVFRNCAIVGNAAGTPGSGHDGGGAYVREGSPLFEDCEFVGNDADGFGGAVFCKYAGTARFVRCIFRENTTSTGGGGVYCNTSADAQFESCTFHGNGGADAGGVCATGTSDVTVENTIISFSAAGAGVYCDGTSSATLTCTDICGNTGGDWTGCVASQFGVNGNFSEDPLFCDAAAGELTIEPESPCAPDNSPAGCGLIGADSVGCEAVIGVDGPVPSVPAAAFLGPAAPNPFNPTTTMSFGIPRAERVRIAVYDVSGRLVDVLIDDVFPAGEFSATWQGRNGAGEGATSGIYFARMRAGAFSETRKLVLMK
ncbi:MAG: right-handed parallel beta-helix repeat-containing protein [Candidatus Eisenbacteria bacterium]